MNKLQTFVYSGAILLFLDLIFISFSYNFFQSQIIRVQHTAFHMKPLGAILCYLILILGLNHFILKPKRPVMDAFFLGILIYGVFETTNYSLLKNWKIETVVLDTLWGGSLFAITTYAMYNFV